MEAGHQNPVSEGSLEGMEPTTDEVVRLALKHLDLFDSHTAPAFLASSWSITAQVVADSTATG